MKPRSQIADPGLFQAILSLSQPTAFQRAFLRREDQLLLTFFGEGSRQLKLNRASLAKQGAESAGRPFSTWCSSTCRSTRKLRDLKSPAPIPDQGLFRAIFQGEVSIKCEGLFLLRHTPGGVGKKITGKNS